MNHVFLFPNFTKEGTRAVTENVIGRLARLDFDVLCDEEAAQSLAPEAAAHCRVLPYSRCLEECGMVLVIGGDGSILRIASDAAAHNRPILGVNTGKVGFLSELDPHELRYLEALSRGKYTIDERMMLDVAIWRQGEVVYRAALLNDAVITKWPLVRLINIDVSVNGTLTTSLRGDGIIIATPTGSTAYTLSAGGPIIEPNANCIAVTPICAHELGAKPFVLSADREITITAGAEENKAFLSPDGGVPVEICPSDTISITRSELVTRLVRLKNLGFYDIIYKKLSI